MRIWFPPAHLANFMISGGVDALQFASNGGRTVYLLIIMLTLECMGACLSAALIIGQAMRCFCLIAIRVWGLPAWNLPRSPFTPIAHPEWMTSGEWFWLQILHFTL